MNKCKPRWLGFILAAIIAFNTLLPFFAFYQSPAASQISVPSTMAKLFGEKVLICTGDGFALVKWSDLKSGKIPVKQHKEFFCPLCYVAASNVGKALIVFVIMVFLAREATNVSLLHLGYTRYKPSLAYAVASPRAPPATF